jgi:hypothetical protein
MRKNRQLLLAAAATLLLGAATACDKSDDDDDGSSSSSSSSSATYCFTCVSKGTYTGTGATGTPTTTRKEVCNLTEAGARSLEASGTSTTTNGSITYTMVTKCTRK